MRPSVKIDFDGTLCKDAWPEIGAPKQGVIDAARCARDAGVALILDTCREGDSLEAALSFCERHGLAFDAVNANLQERIEHYGGDCRKVSADYIIDDRAVGYSDEAAIRLLIKLANGMV